MPSLLVSSIFIRCRVDFKWRSVPAKNILSFNLSALLQYNAIKLTLVLRSHECNVRNIFGLLRCVLDHAPQILTGGWTKNRSFAGHSIHYSSETGRVDDWFLVNHRAIIGGRSNTHRSKPSILRTFRVTVSLRVIARKACFRCHPGKRASRAPWAFAR